MVKKRANTGYNPRLKKKNLDYEYIKHIQSEDKSLRSYYKEKGLYRGNWITQVSCWTLTMIVIFVSFAIPFHFILAKEYLVLLDWTVNIHIYDMFATILTVIGFRTRLKELFFTGSGALLLTGLLGVAYDPPIHAVNIAVAVIMICLSFNNYNYRANTITKMIFSAWITAVAFVVNVISNNFDVSGASLGGLSGSGSYYEGLLAIGIDIGNWKIQIGVLVVGLILVILFTIVWDRTLDWIYKHFILQNRIYGSEVKRLINSKDEIYKNSKILGKKGK